MPSLFGFPYFYCKSFAGLVCGQERHYSFTKIRGLEKASTLDKYDDCKVWSKDLFFSQTACGKYPLCNVFSGTLWNPKSVEARWSQRWRDYRGETTRRAAPNLLQSRRRHLNDSVITSCHSEQWKQWSRRMGDGPTGNRYTCHTCS